MDAYDKRREVSIEIIGALQEALEEEGLETSALMEFRIAETVYNAIEKFLPDNGE
jgi:hypothetical protein